MLKWHQRIAKEMARRDAHYQTMDEWFKNHPPESGDIILKESELPHWMRRNYRPAPPAVKPIYQPPIVSAKIDKPQGVSKEWLTSQSQKLSPQ